MGGHWNTCDLPMEVVVLGQKRTAGRGAKRWEEGESDQNPRVKMLYGNLWKLIKINILNFKPNGEMGFSF